jgi:pimeloyl-ACP methyl ester carboxylesterase
MTEFADADTAGGVRLAYDSAGRGEPAMLFIHGWCCDRTYFAPQLTHFAADHAVAALDLRGHGDSDRPEPGAGVYDDISGFADDALAVARAAGFDRPVVVGHSLGGLVSLACAARSGAVRAAAMLASAPVLDPEGKAALAQSFPAIAADEDGSWRTAFASGLFLPTDSVRRDEIIAQMAALPAEIAAAELRAMERFHGASALARTEVPLLSVDPADAEPELRAESPGIAIGRTVGAGHFIQLEVPEQVNAMIERFLAINGL